MLFVVAILISVCVQCNSYRSTTLAADKLVSALIRSKLHLNAPSSDLVERVSTNINRGSIIVIKYGGHAMENADLQRSFSADVGYLCRLGILPVIVHGGGPQIQKMLKALNVESRFVQGLRVTDERTLEIAQMVAFIYSCVMTN